MILAYFIVSAHFTLQIRGMSACIKSFWQFKLYLGSDLLLKLWHSFNPFSLNIDIAILECSLSLIPQIPIQISSAIEDYRTY